MAPFTPGDADRRRETQMPFEGVPAHLKGPLLTWLRAQFYNPWSSDWDYARAAELAVQLWVEIRGVNPAVELLALASEDDELMLRLIERTLPYSSPESSGSLRKLLEDGFSAYAVTPDGQRLEWRVDPTTRAVVSSAIDSSAEDSAGRHLANAWNSAFGLDPRASVSYGESIRAVEVALRPVVTPRDTLKPQLGRMISAMEVAPEKWTFAVRDGEVSAVETVTQLLKVLRDGQRGRHGGHEQTLREARAAVMIATAVVQWCSDSTLTPSS